MKRALLTLLATLAVAAPAQAATITVTSFEDSGNALCPSTNQCTLRRAIELSKTNGGTNSADTIVLQAGTYDLSALQQISTGGAMTSPALKHALLELLPHLLLGDITRWLVERGPVAEVLAVLEHHIDAGDADVQNAIAVSFLENLFGDDPGELAVRAALGPRLKAEFHAMESWTPDDPEAAT